MDEMNFKFEGGSELSGTLLIAHPSLLDSNFRKSIVLISAHSDDEGTVGVIINRPLKKTLGEHDEDFAFGSLSDVPLYQGGPVGDDRLILTAWQWTEDERVFKLHFGISFEKAQEIIIEDPEVEIRGFLGYSGWGKDQLAQEREQNAWIVSVVSETCLQGEKEEQLWKEVLSQVSPEMAFLALAPDDPSVN